MTWQEYSVAYITNKVIACDWAKYKQLNNGHHADALNRHNRTIKIWGSSIVYYDFWEVGALWLGSCDSSQSCHTERVVCISSFKCRNKNTQAYTEEMLFRKH